MAKHFLFKSEPSVYSFETLSKEKKTNWDHVRNYQARNVLKSCVKGDYALIYHSNDEKAVVGIAQVVKEAYPDVDPEKKGEWVQVDLKHVLGFEASVPLEKIKTTASLKNLPLIKQSRLSCMPISAKEFEALLKLGGVWDTFQK